MNPYRVALLPFVLAAAVAHAGGTIALLLRCSFLRRFAFCLLALISVCAPLSAHQVETDYNLSVTVEKKGEALVETIYIPAWFLMSSAFPNGATYAGQSGKTGENEAMVTAWMAKQNPVLIDGRESPPKLTKMKALSTFVSDGEQHFPDSGKDSGLSDEQFGHMTTVRLDFTYAVGSDAKNIAVRWGAYIERTRPDSPKETLGTSLSFFADDKFHIADLNPQEPEWVWHSEAVTPPPPSTLISEKWTDTKIAVPWFAILAGTAGLAAVVVLRRRRGAALVAGAIAATVVVAVFVTKAGPAAVSISDPFRKRLVTPSGAQAQAMFDGILHGVYKSFEYNKDGQIYDALAQCVDGPLLEKTYKDVRGSLVLDESEGGALCQVDKVEVSRAELQPSLPTDEPNSVRLRCSWTVRGKVSHWGHTHVRANAYEAVCTLAPRVAQGGLRWKLTGCEVSEQKPVEVVPEKKP